MGIKEIEKEIEEVKSRLNNLENILGEMKKEEGNVQWVPEYGDDYCCIVSGAIKTYNWYGSIFDYSCLEIGNVFKSAEEAEFMVEKLKVIRELKKYSCRFIPEGRDNIYIIYNYMDNIVDYKSAYYNKQDEIYFIDKETAMHTVEMVGEDRVKKYYLGVEDDDRVESYCIG